LIRDRYSLKDSCLDSLDDVTIPDTSLLGLNSSNNFTSDETQLRKKRRLKLISEARTVELHWFLLTSANLSQAAWGVVQVSEFFTLLIVM
jgi:hypothetical protein